MEQWLQGDKQEKKEEKIATALNLKLWALSRRKKNGLHSKVFTADARDESLTKSQKEEEKKIFI